MPFSTTFLRLYKHRVRLLHEAIPEPNRPLSSIHNQSGPSLTHIAANSAGSPTSGSFSWYSRKSCVAKSFSCCSGHVGAWVPLSADLLPIF